MTFLNTLVTIVMIQQRNAQIKTSGYEYISFAFDSKHAILGHVIHLPGSWLQNYFTELKINCVDTFGDKVCVPAGQLFGSLSLSIYIRYGKLILHKTKHATV